MDYKFAVRFSEDETASSLFMKEPINEDFTEEEFLGRKCKVYVIPKQGIPDRKIYFWEGVVLREVIEQTYEGITYISDIAATDIKINVKIPKNKFKVPWGIKFVSKEEAESITIKQIEKSLR